MKGRPFRPVRSITPTEAGYHHLQHAIAQGRRTRDGKIIGLPGGYLTAALQGVTRALGVPDGSVVPWLGVSTRPGPCPVCALPVRKRRRLSPLSDGVVNVNVATFGWAGPPPGMSPMLIAQAEAEARLIMAERHRREGQVRR